jgi:hypothetical protein
MVLSFVQAITFASWAAWSGLWLLQAGTGTMTNGTDVAFGLTLVEDQPDDRFQSIEYSELSKAIRDQVENYLAMFLKPAALPKAAPTVRTRIFRAANSDQDDLVELSWSFQKHDCRALQSLNAVKLEIARGASGPNELRSLADDMVRLTGDDVVGRAYAVSLQWPAALTPGTTFSSNPKADITSLRVWHERVDAIVERASLTLLFYKKVPQLMGYQDGSGWFKKYWAR